MQRIHLPQLRPTLFAALAFGVSAVSLLAQAPSPGGSPDGPPDGPPPGHHGPPPSPLFRALDTNHDGVISAEEIANAPAVLKQLAGPSGQLTHEMLRPPRREGDHEGPDGDRPGPGAQDENRRRRGPHPDAQDSPSGSPDGQEHPPHRPPPPDGPRDQRKAPADASPSASPGTSPAAGPGPGPGDRHHGPPHHDPLFEALDTNHDGVITADEIEAAAASLKKADRNGDGQIDRKDFGPPPPPPGAAPQ